MTRKHYNELAARIRQTLEAYPDNPVRSALIKDLTQILCDTLKQDNPAFDRTRFLTACGF